MRIRVQITFIGGATFEDTTSEFPTLDACVSVIRDAMAAPRTAITWVGLGSGEHVLINPAAIAAVKLSEARP